MQKCRKFFYNFSRFCLLIKNILVKNSIRFHQHFHGVLHIFSLLCLNSCNSLWCDYFQFSCYTCDKLNDIHFAHINMKAFFVDYLGKMWIYSNLFNPHCILSCHWDTCACTSQFNVKIHHCHSCSIQKQSFKIPQNSLQIHHFQTFTALNLQLIPY